MTDQELKPFYLERDFYSEAQVVIVWALTLEDATSLWDTHLKTIENYSPGTFGELTELKPPKKGEKIVFLSPPGDGHLIR